MPSSLASNIPMQSPRQQNIAMPSPIYEQTLRSAQYGHRQYPTQEDAGSWDDLSENAITRGGNLGFSLSGPELETDLPVENRIEAEES